MTVQLAGATLFQKHACHFTRTFFLFGALVDLSQAELLIDCLEQR